MQQDTRLAIIMRIRVQKQMRLVVCNLLRQTVIAVVGQDIRVPTVLKKTPAQETNGLLYVQSRTCKHKRARKMIRT
jgi:hypothetical protein